MALYEGNLTEFIDWISNKDLLTNRQFISDENQISGGSIRQLLQSHLRKPFFVYEDTDNNKKYLFSSEESKIRYFNALELVGGDTASLEQKYKDLILLEFNIPAPYKVYCTDGNGESLKTINILEGSARRLIDFRVYIDELNSGYLSAFDVKYTLMNSANQVIFEDLRSYDAELSDGQHTIQFDCFDYLSVGNNKLQLTIKLTGGLYTADPINPIITINVIKYNISGNFTGINWYDGILVGSDLPMTISVDRSISTAVSQTLEYYIDDLNSAKGYKETNIEGKNTTVQLKIDNQHIKNLAYPTSDNMHPKHYLLIKGNMKTVDNSINFNSNSLLYEFVTLSEEQEQLNNHYINIKYSIPAGMLETENGFEGICLIGNQYEEFKLEWTYYTNGQVDASVNITWELQKIDLQNPDNNEVIHLSTLSGIHGQAGEPLKFIPDKAYLKEENWHLVANVIGTNQTYYNVFDRQIIIIKSAYDFEFDEFAGYYFKLNAYGRSNTESETTRKTWIPTGQITQTQSIPQTVFSESMPWDNANGWSNNGLTLNSEYNYGIIPFNAFPAGSDNTIGIAKFGRTIEIDFMTGSVENENDPLIIIGNKNENNRTGQNGPAIYIYPTKAVLYSGSSEIVKTNYKSNERIQLTFIFEPNKDEAPSNKLTSEASMSSKNVYIVNNGILERGALLDNSLSLSEGQIKFGGTNSQITIYNMRVWWFYMPIYNAFTNFLFDTPDKSKYIIRNSILKGNTIDYQSCLSKIDTILITGDLSTVLLAGADKDTSETAVDIKYDTPTDKKYLGFTANQIKIRKHGQSTLNYPIASFKFWLNKTKGENQAHVEFNDGVKNLQLVKNRYPLNIGSIPANKYVLQANYADSSGVHNGGLLRLINDTWYNAPFKVGTGNEVEYKLRTAPQLFASSQLVHHNNVKLNEIESENPELNTAWVEGYGNNDEFILNGLKATEHTWGDLKSSLTNDPENRSFPYKIRNAPDSRPVVVFYTDTSKDSTTKKFLGQFVLMDDKKSDHIFGERSIYLWGDGTDPFCMTSEGALTEVRNKNGNIKNGYDLDENCVWDNKNVLRIECVLINTALTSFMNFNVSGTIEYYTEEDKNNGLIPEGSAVGDPKGDGTGNIPASNIKYQTDPITNEFILDSGGNKIPLNYYWEDYFEMIFPDEDDLSEDDAKKGLTKFDVNSKFVKKATPWINFLQWICGIGQLNTNSQGIQYSDGTVSEAALNEFKRTAHDHLDLYKIAAYYIFYIRFGLVDSVERNAQYKTYDGQHWFLEAWDMDIALGNKNTGGLAFDPPMDRTTLLDPTKGLYAYSGRSVSTSNVLWDCLEAWDDWRDGVVPEVAQALYDGGLTYEKITEMFDENYANKWSEIIYNESGLYKYVEKAQEAAWLAWLQGARTSHRHWWISTSMNYYDSKWTCGQFNSSRIYLAVDKPQGTAATIQIIPTTESYFKLTQMDTKLSRGLQRATKQSPATWVADNWSFSAKDPTHIFGALFMEKIYLGNFGQGIQVLSFQNAVDPVLGATIKEISIGNNLPNNIESIIANGGSFNGWVNTVKPNITNSASTTSIENDESIDALENVVTYNLIGQLGLTSADIITSIRNKLKNIYAIGTGFTTLTSSLIGNKYENLYLPGETIVYDNNNVQQPVINGVTSINVTNTSWQHISFWRTTYHQSSTQTIRYEDENHEPILDDNGQEIYINVPTTSTFEKMSRIPKSFNTVAFKGSTASNKCSIQFILDWFDSIEYYIRTDNPSLSGDDLEEAVLNYIGENCHALIENIRWNYGIKREINGEANPAYTDITYKDVIRLGYLNGKPDNNGHGVNYGAGSNLTGYIKIYGDPMTPAQLSQLINLFGENVFSINTINSNLVIDQETTYAQISVSGDILLEQDPDDGKTYITSHEGKTIKLKCTSFLLSAESVDDYIWSVEEHHGYQQDSQGGIPSSPDGFTKNLILYQTATTARYYDIYVRAEKRNNPNINSVVTIRIYPAKTALNFKWSLINQESSVRKFICDESTAQTMFGQNAVVNHQIKDMFIMPTNNLTAEFKIDTDTLDADAKINKIHITCSELSSLGSNDSSISLTENARSGWDCDDISINSNEYINITNTNDPEPYGIINIVKNANSFVKYTEKTVNNILTGVHNSVVLWTCKDEINNEKFKTNCQDMRFFSLNAQIYYESAAIGVHTYSCYIILYDDNNAILTSTQKSFNTVKAKLQLIDNDMYRTRNSLFKSDLSVLSGTLDFTSVNDINQSAFVTAYNANISIFDYMPNITELNLSGLTYDFTANSNIEFFNMNKLKSLQVLKLNNCTNAGCKFTIKDSLSLLEIDFGGTCNASLKCVNNRNLTTIKLGIPNSVYISECPSLVDSNITITDNSLITSIDLLAAGENLIMFKTLNKLLS